MTVSSAVVFSISMTQDEFFYRSKLQIHHYISLKGNLVKEDLDKSMLVVVFQLLMQMIE